MAIAFLQSNSSATDATVYTFSGENLGTAASDRHIIVAVNTRRGNATALTMTVTVGGISATTVIQRSDTISSSRNFSGIAIAAVPTGATGDVVVTFSGSTLRCSIGLWRVDNLSSATPTDIDGGVRTTNTPVSINLDVPIGFAIACGVGQGGPASWSGLTENFDIIPEGTLATTGASVELGTAETGRAISVNFNIAGQQMVAAAWAYNSAAAVRAFGGIVG